MTTMMQSPFRKPAPRARFAKVLAYGDTGVGKTDFGLRAPKPAVIDLENGTEWFRGRPGFSDWEVMEGLTGDPVNQVHLALSFLESGFQKETIYDPILKRHVERLTDRRVLLRDEVTGIEYPVHDRETLMIDPVTLVWEQIQFDQTLKIERSNRENKEDFTWKDHGEMKRDYKSIMNRLIQLPMHVYVTARLKDERDKDTGRVIGETADAEKSTRYSFDLVFQLINARDKHNPDRRDAIIIKDRSHTYRQYDRVENVSWQTLVVPILQRLQAQAPHEDAVREMAKAWRLAGVTDLAARVVIERRTGKTRTQDLTLPEIQELTRYFLSLRQDGGDGGGQGGPGGDDAAGAPDAGGEAGLIDGEGTPAE